MNPSSPTSSGRAFFLTGVAVGIAAQIFAIIMAFRSGGALRTLLADLGMTPPLVTRLFLATYHWWVGAPAVSALLAADVARRPGPPLPYAVVVLLLTVVAGAAFEAWLHAAWLEPLLTMITRVR
jgi:hypothetical protein